MSLIQFTHAIDETRVRIAFIWVAKNCNSGRWLLSADTLRDHLIENDEEDNEQVAVPSGLKVEASEECNVCVDRRRLANFCAVTASRVLDQGVVVHGAVRRYDHSAAVAFTCKRSSCVISEVERDDRHALVHAVDSQEVHEGNSTGKTRLCYDRLLLARCEDFTSIVWVQVEGYRGVSLAEDLLIVCDIS